MESEVRRGRPALVVAALAIAVLALVEVDVARSLSLTSDEPVDMAAGYSDLVHGDQIFCTEHPPLVKLIGGAVLCGLGVKERSAADIYATALVTPPGIFKPQFLYSKRLIVYDNPDARFADARPGVDAITTAARLPFALVFPALTAAVAFAWGRRLWGDGGALVALGLVVTCPDVLGWGALVMTDAPAAALSLAAAFAMDSVLRGRGRRWIAALGAAGGLALISKFSAAFAVLGIAGAAVVAVARPIDDAPPSIDHPFGGSGARARTAGLALLAASAISIIIIWVGYLGANPIASWLDGARSVYKNSVPDYLGLCLGRYAPRFWYYFPVALGLKLPLGTLGLFALGAAVAVARRARAAEEALVHLPALAVLLAATLWAMPTGTRYVLPALPFLFVSAGRAGAWAGKSKARWAPIVLFLASNLVVNVRDHPFHSSSTNPIAGDPRLVYRLLEDSNQDYGGGIKALGEWQRAHDAPPLQVVTFCHATHDSALLAAYGLPGESIFTVEPLFYPQPGQVYAVSTHMASRAVCSEILSIEKARELGQEPAHLILAGRTEPKLDASGLVGGGFLIFDLRQGRR
jgi:4-amino-4-deoxy-L-arabinose transferase-like glycosyltransferase